MLVCRSKPVIGGSPRCAIGGIPPRGQHSADSHRRWVGQNKLGGLYVRFETSKPTAEVADFGAFPAFDGVFPTGTTRAWNAVGHWTSSPPHWLFRVDGPTDTNPEGSPALQIYGSRQTDLL